MQRRSLHLLAGSLLALGAVLLLILWGAGQAFRRPVVRRPNGEVLRLEAVTYGTGHQWVPQAWWQRLLGPMLPPSMATQPYVTRFYPSGNTQPHLVFWFTGPDAPLGRGRSQDYVFAADESGREYARASGLYEWRAHSPRVEYFRVSLPKRGGTVSLRFYGPSGPAFAALTVPVPAAGAGPAPASAAVSGPGSAGLPPAPAPHAPSCPVTARAGDVSITLVELTPGLSSGGRDRSRPEVLLQQPGVPASPGDLPWTRAALRVDGAPAWRPLAVILRDAGGDTASQRYQQERRGLTWAAIPGFIARDGDPLAVRVVLLRQNSQAYRPEQLWTVPGVSVPPDGKETTLNLSRTVRGVRLEVHALAARGTTTGPGRRDLEKKPYLRLRAGSLARDRLLSVWAVDERGRRYDADLRAYGGSGTPYDYRIRMPIARSARRVTLHFAVHSGFETKTVDLAARPSPVNPALAR